MIDVDTLERIWIVTLLIYVVVLAVVAVLLTLILRAARDIRDAVAAVWTVGQRIANNTIHIALLGTTNHVAAGILDAAQGVARATAALKAHAEACRRCPACVLGPETGR